MTAFEATFAGVTLGCAPYAVRRWAGLDLPAVRAGDAFRPHAHGLVAGRDLAEGRVIQFDLVVEDDNGDPAALDGTLAVLDAAFVISELERPLVWQLPGQVQRQAMVRCRRRAMVLDVNYAAGIAHVAVELVATDPLMYAAALSSASSALGTTTGGLTFPAAAPFVFGTAGSSGVMSCANEGTFAAPWTATFTGPLVAPELVRLGSGERLTLSGASLAAGETLVVDSAARTVLLDGTASRYGWLSPASRWFDLQPGDNSLQLLGASGAGSVTVEWRSAWM